MSYKDMETIKILFDIDYVEYKTYKYLPDDLKEKYISRFKKKISVEDFDKFCSEPLLTIEKKKLLRVYNIREQDIPFYTSIDMIKSWREKNIDFNRDLKISLLCQ
jgi:hypothetical protein